jgi:hypothetical protein
MIFDIESDLIQKAKFVAGRHLTDDPKESVYANGVARDSVRIVFTYANLNDLEVQSKCLLECTN